MVPWTALRLLQVLGTDVRALDNDALAVVHNAEDLTDDALGGTLGHDDGVTLTNVAWHG
jgi:hypothetical protein